MADPHIVDLLSRSQFVFEGSVTALRQSTVTDVPADANTVVVNVTRVLQGPAALSKLAGSNVTVQLLAGSPRLAVGASTVLYTVGVAFGENVAVAEVGRSTPEAAGGSTMAAGVKAVLTGARSGRAHPVLDAAQQLADDQFRAHADAVAAVVIGRVSSLKKAGPMIASEHDANWWKATIAVEHCEKGDLKGRVDVLYPNSSDIRWARVPRPQAGQVGLWLLHPTPTERTDLAPYSLLDENDFKPADQLERLQGGGQ